MLPVAGNALQPDLAAEQVRELAADGEPEAGAAVLAATVPASACWNASKMIFCFSGGMPMPVSLTVKRTTVGRLAERRMVRAPAAAGDRHLEPDAAVAR